jgi:hypothetical protein
MPTKVVHIKKDKYDVYIGRGSPFGNPYTHLPLQNTQAQVQVKSREDAIKKYNEYFYKRIETDPEFLDDILRLKDKVLGCYCAPNDCHGHIISKFLDNL